MLYAAIDGWKAIALAMTRDFAEAAKMAEQAQKKLTDALTDVIDIPSRVGDQFDELKNTQQAAFDAIGDSLDELAPKVEANMQTIKEAILGVEKQAKSTSNALEQMGPNRPDNPFKPLSDAELEKRKKEEEKAKRELEKELNKQFGGKSRVRGGSLGGSSSSGRGGQEAKRFVAFEDDDGRVKYRDMVTGRVKVGGIRDKSTIDFSRVMQDNARKFGFDGGKGGEEMKRESSKIDHLKNIDERLAKLDKALSA